MNCGNLQQWLYLSILNKPHLIYTTCKLKYENIREASDQIFLKSFFQKKKRNRQFKSVVLENIRLQTKKLKKIGKRNK